MSIMRKAVIIGLLAAAVSISSRARGASTEAIVLIKQNQCGIVSASTEAVDLMNQNQCGLVSASDVQDRTMVTAAYQHAQLLSEVDENVTCWQGQKRWLGYVAPLYYAQDVVQHMQHLHIDQEWD